MSGVNVNLNKWRCKISASLCACFEATVRYLQMCLGPVKPVEPPKRPVVPMVLQKKSNPKSDRISKPDVGIGGKSTSFFFNIRDFCCYCCNK